jgi:methylase of polypeptide subunit release factors
LCVYLTQLCVNPTQVCVNLTQVCVNRTQVFVNPTQVLELGAGTGALGIGLAARGAAVTLTDLEAVLPLTRRNVEANAATFSGRGTAVVVRGMPVRGLREQ